MRWKIFLYSSALLVTLIVATLLFVTFRSRVYVDARVTEALANSRERILKVKGDRKATLLSTASLVASFPELKALLDTDTDTVRDFLLAYQRENRRSELLVALDPEGRVIARTDEEAPVPIPEVRSHWLQPVLDAGEAEGFFVTGTEIYLAVAVPAEAGDKLFGFVIAGTRINNEFAASLTSNNSRIVIVSDRILGSSVSRTMSWNTIGDWLAIPHSTDGTKRVTVGREQFIATDFALSDQSPPVLAIILQSLDQATEPYRNIQLGLLVLGLLVTAAGIAGSALLAETITSPVARLLQATKEVASGKLEHRIDVDTGDEIGELATSFNHMLDERQRLELQIRQSQKMEAVGRLAGGVAHDFNNLLTVIIGRAEMLMGRMGTSSPMFDDVGLILESSERAANLTRQLLAFSRRQVLQPRILNLNAFLSRMGNMVRRLVGEDVELHLELAPDLKRIKADPSQVEQVVMNLVVNARDAMPSGGKLIIRTVDVQLAEPRVNAHMSVPEGSYVLLEVQDSGMGISDEVRPHLFEPFFTTKDPSKGTGLGLSTVYGIVRQSNGYIDVETGPHQGSRFQIYLPAFDDLDVPAPSPKAPMVLAGTETILLVEDEDSVRHLAAEILTSFGYKVLKAASGADAIAICDSYEHPIHLLISDVLMAQLNGPELAARIRILRPTVRVMFISGYTERAENLLAGDAAFLQKPFTMRELGEKVKEVLSASRPAGRSGSNLLTD